MGTVSQERLAQVFVEIADTLVFGGGGAGLLGVVGGGFGGFGDRGRGGGQSWSSERPQGLACLEWSVS